MVRDERIQTTDRRITGQDSIKIHSTIISITVIIPTYNMASYLPEAIVSVIESGIKDLELFIVDDGSTDHTRSVVERLLESEPDRISQKIRYRQISHRGKAAAINIALEQAEGEYITILDADDKLPEDSLRMRYKRAEETGAELVLGGFSTFDHSQLFGYRPPPGNDGREQLINRLLLNLKSPFHQNSMLISRSLIERAGPYDEDLIRAQDKDYAIRLIKLARGIEIIDEPVYLYRRYERGYTAKLVNRLRTIRYKSVVISKHTGGLNRWVALAWSSLVEIGKLGYELFGTYKG